MNGTERRAWHHRSLYNANGIAPVYSQHAVLTLLMGLFDSSLLAPPDTRDNKSILTAGNNRGTIQGQNQQNVEFTFTVTKADYLTKALRHPSDARTE